jgi:2-polyprenyl-3-methyl-5-hydroxy-6-metoxy-1,4-benzoquinol methylase
LEAKSLQNVLIKLARSLDENHIPYQFTGPCALLLQGVKINEWDQIHILIQWDVFETVYSLVSSYLPSEIERTASHAQFFITMDELPVCFECQFNTTIRTDPYRISVKIDDSDLWVTSLYSIIYNQELQQKYGVNIQHFLKSKQDEITLQNQKAWNQDQYNDLIERYGEQNKLSEKIKKNPEWRLHPFYPYLGDLKNKKVIHLLGSNGIKGTALALLGADVTIVDFSEENAMYAKKLAEAAKVKLEYITSDVFSIKDKMENEADLVLMELGVLHYFMDLKLLFHLIQKILKQGGRFVLHEFHPISTKLITSSGKKHKVTGNYFNPSIEELNVAFSKHLSEEKQKNLVRVKQRKWTLGEIITSAAQAGMMINVLEEEPNHKIDDIGLPKTFTLVTEKISPNL